MYCGRKNGVPSVHVSAYQQENAAKRYECACNSLLVLLLPAND